eukprot:229681_1
MSPTHLVVGLMVFACIGIDVDCYSFTSSGSINLTKDNGWSEMGVACVGYTNSTNHTDWIYHTAGSVDIQLIAPDNIPIVTIIFYDDQSNSYPMVNNSDLTCNDKIYGNNNIGNYARLRENVQLSPNNPFQRTIGIHEHIRPRYWWFYLANCNQTVNLNYPIISYNLHYWDCNDSVGICTQPTTTESSSTTSSSTTSSSTSSS